MDLAGRASSGFVVFVNCKDKKINISIFYDFCGCFNVTVVIVSKQWKMKTYKKNLINRDVIDEIEHKSK